MTGYAVGPLIWPFMVSFVVNPLNLTPSFIIIENGSAVGYFG